MTAADWDREPTSDAERERWRVRVEGSQMVFTDDETCTYVGRFDTPALAAEAVWAHNVMHAAREKRALGVETFLRGHAEGREMVRLLFGEGVV